MCKQEKGVSLVELLIAVTILLVGLVPMMRAFLFSLETGNRARKMTIATNLARDMSEEIRSKAFSEEYADYKDNEWKKVYPNTTSTQRFGLEHDADDPENADATSIQAGGKGRIMMFDDVDDYDGWCRGDDCGVTPVKALETFDGLKYGTSGLTNMNGYTRRVRVRNLFPAFQVQTSYNPYYSLDDVAAGTVTTEKYKANLIEFKRYDFENWSSCCRRNEDGKDVTGKSSLKVIEVTVTYEGPGMAPIRVQDLSFVTSPMDGPKGE